jgi:hypothetical protein
MVSFFSSALWWMARLCGLIVRALPTATAVPLDHKIKLSARKQNSDSGETIINLKQFNPYNIMLSQLGLVRQSGIENGPGRHQGLD